jgi:uroporphyrinogen decarboxylase
MKRKIFLRNSLLATGALMAGSSLSGFKGFKPAISKRDRMLAWLEGKTDPGFTPAAFFLHFDSDHRVGLPAAKKHLEYFRYTDMDFVKIQYEQDYTPADFLNKPSDWSKLSPKKADFYEPQLQTVREIVKQEKKNALILMTIYSPFMCAGQTATYDKLYKHLEEDPEQVKKGFDALTESQLVFVRKCMEIGVDGFYMSTEGSESGQFTNPDIFRKYIKPTDLIPMREVTAKCPFNILHVCDYVAPYNNYDEVLDYPGQVVNCNTRLKDSTLSWQQISAMFKRPNMGGMDRHGAINTGTPEQIAAEVKRTIEQAPKQFILGADCTVDGKTDWNKLKHAIAIAHGG